VLLDAALLACVEENLCFREPGRETTLLVFPEQVTQHQPRDNDAHCEEGPAYTLAGPLEDLYGLLAVRLGYAPAFARTALWHQQAEYEARPGETCGLKVTAQRDREMDVELYFHPAVPAPTRQIFQALFERLLSVRQLAVTRFPPVICAACRYPQERAEVVRRQRDGQAFIFCGNCGEKLELPRPSPATVFQGEERQGVVQQQVAAALRGKFEACLARLRVLNRRGQAPSCFLSHAAGAPEHERWIVRLARDMRNAGLSVQTGRRGSPDASAGGRPSDSISRCDVVLVVGTPQYLQQFENISAEEPFFAAEVGHINRRLIGNDEQKASVWPLLRSGETKRSLPVLARGHPYADFRRDEDYCGMLYDLILSLYKIPFTTPAMREAREALRPERSGLKAAGQGSE
jgi:hypothetical protein